MDTHEKIQQILKNGNILSHLNHGIQIAKMHDGNEGLHLAKELLYAITDKRSVVYLSGGRTPKELYHGIAKEEKLDPGAVGQIDERFGEKFHNNSNEEMMQDAGLLRYLQMRDIHFYPILQLPGHPELVSGSLNQEMLNQVQHDKIRKQTAEKYDTTVRELQNVYQNHIGVLGIGLDGHTAGIAGNRPDFTNPMFASDRKSLWVSEFNDQKGMYKERVSMTFLGLSMLNFLIVLVFGEDKKEALEKMFTEGKEEEIPSRFYKRPDIAKKTLLITDQNV